MKKTKSSGMPAGFCRSLPGACLLVSTLLVFVPGPSRAEGARQVALPELSAGADVALSAEEERRLGQRFMRELRRAVDIIDRPEIESYVQGLGARLVAAADVQDLEFTFFVVNEPEINAFAAPGGFIGINAGLFTATESESELAAVLAHEIAHVTQRHIARRIEVDDRYTLPSIAAMVAAILIGTQNSEAGAAAIMAVQAGAAQLQINFTRQNEEEADRVGIDILQGADFDPAAMPGFFERLQESMRYYAKPPEMLSTHPVTVNRIADSRARIKTLGYKQYPDSLRYLLIKERLLSTRELKADLHLKRVQTQIEKGQFRDRRVARFGLALAARRAGQPQLAMEVLSELLEALPSETMLVAELAEMEAENGLLNQSLARYRKALNLYPGDRALVSGYARSLLASDQSEKAVELLRGFAHEQELDAGMYSQLAQAEEATNHPLEAHLALAESHYQRGDIKAAVELLKRARPLLGDDLYHDARLTARLKELEEESGRREKP